MKYSKQVQDLTRFTPKGRRRVRKILPILAFHDVTWADVESARAIASQRECKFTNGGRNDFSPLSGA